MPRKIDPSGIQTGSGVSSQSLDLPNLTAHTLGTAQHSHNASSISIDDTRDDYESYEVEGSLEELAALIPPKPPTLGNQFKYLNFTGIPDWGYLRNFVPGNNDLEENIDNNFPTYAKRFDPSDEIPPFSENTLEDPKTDPVFNIRDESGDPYPGNYLGGGVGLTRPGAFIRSGGDMVLSSRIAYYYNAPTFPVFSCVVSGSVYPADRGVLAIIHFPSGGDMVSFLAQPLLQRCPAAILLGQGITASGPDGLPGGMFSTDNFGFPGKASGQYDLEELHTGFSTIDGSPLPITADNTKGKVRLGTDPNAGITPIVGGIPIFGATSAGEGGGHPYNFFRYRLPYLDNYEVLRFTPEEEKPRYFMKPIFSLDPAEDLAQAGNYPNFPKDYWNFQVARYRHKFFLNSTVTHPLPRESGTYILMHFKKETDFENLVRDGVAPTDDMLYSPNLVNWTNVEAIENAVEDDAANGNPSAPCYHVIRSAVYEDPNNGTYTFGVSPTPMSLIIVGGYQTMSVSGIKYFTAARNAGSPTLGISTFNNVNGLFHRSFYTGNPGVTGDAYPATENPMIISIASFSYGVDNTGDPTYDLQAPYTTQIKKNQRVELTMEELGYSLASPPPEAPTNVVFSTQFYMEGDYEKPAFTTGAKPKLYAVKPPATQYDAPTFYGANAPLGSGKEMLLHTTYFDPTLPNYGSPLYGNFSVIHPSQYFFLRQVEERFLDEVSRISITEITSLGMYGPGLAVVSPDTSITTQNAPDWISSGNHLLNLTTLAGEAQVAGLSDSDWFVYDDGTTMTTPFPSNGMLIYPQFDYTTGFRPSLIDGDVGLAQFDYSTVTGDVEYYRCFDVAFSQSPDREVYPDSQTRLTMRVWGLVPDDFDFANGSRGVEIYIKVPGLTTWMDIGRLNGTGPSKQDLALDGAGCKIDFGEDADIATGTVYSDIFMDVGPDAYFFRNTARECIVLLKVVIKDTATGKGLLFTTLGSNPLERKGILGFEILRPE